jgi:2-keto-3-deoxy-galactonokinase
MVARQGVQQQASELLTERLSEAQSGGDVLELFAVRAGAVLGELRQSRGERLGSVHAPGIGARPSRTDPSRE